MVEILSCGGVECHRPGIAILRMRGDISHTDNDRVRNELTGHIPGSELGRVDGLSCAPNVPNRRLQNIVQEVGRVGPRGVKSVAVSLWERKR